MSFGAAGIFMANALGFRLHDLGPSNRHDNAKQWGLA